jgi:hypothetical protein
MVSGLFICFMESRNRLKRNDEIIVNYQLSEWYLGVNFKEFENNQEIIWK